MSHPVSTERVLSTLNTDGSRRWIDPRTSKGPHWRRRRVVAYLLMALFVSLPFVRIGGRPALLLDLVKREFTFFGTTFFSNDTVLLMLFLLGAFVSVFLVTAVVGRAWCGWACPQTVYMEWLFRPIEKWLEPKGASHVRLRRVAKYAVFALLAVFLAHVFLGYFVPVEQLAGWVLGSPTAHWASFLLVCAVSALVFVDFAYFREQMCVVACPYARLQSGLLDRDSLIIGYDARRGEPRGKLTVLQNTGDCIDCRACVTTCPTGIDIRQGLQLECIACAQCADACDAIMDRVGKPRGLVGYTSQARLAAAPGSKVRGRLIVYPLVLLVLGALFVFQLGRRDGVELTVVRATGEPFREMADGRIANAFKVRLRNRDAEPHRYTIALLDAPGFELVSGAGEVTVAGRARDTVDVFVVASREVMASGPSVQVVVRDVDTPELTPEKASVRLLGPSPAAIHKEVP